MIATANPSKQTSITMLVWWYEVMDSCFAAWCGVLVLTVFVMDDLSNSDPVAKWEHDNYKKGFSNHFHFSLVVISSTGKTYSIGLPSLAIVGLCKFYLTSWIDPEVFSSYLARHKKREDNCLQIVMGGHGSTYLPRSSLIHFACTGVVPLDFSRGSNSNAGKMDQTWSNIYQ